MKFLLLLLTATVLCYGESAIPHIKLRDSLQTGCAPDAKADDVIETLDVKQGPILFFTRKVRVKLPSSGVYPDKIKCVMLSDNTHSHNFATISRGGIGVNYVEIELVSAPSWGLDYKIEVVRPAAT